MHGWDFFPSKQRESVESGVTARAEDLPMLSADFVLSGVWFVVAVNEN